MSPQPSVREVTLHSQALGQDRLVSVFEPTDRDVRTPCPALFCADGQALAGFAATLGQAVNTGHCPAVILVGVHSDPEYRNREYLAEMNPARFAAHEAFFTAEVYEWASLTFPIDRGACGVFGFSCGAAFALSAGTRHPEKYRRVIAFSVAGGTARLKQADFPRERSPRFYLSAGTHEVSFRETTAAVAAILTTRGISHTLTERAGGHDPLFWNNELPEAVRWCFSSDHPESARAVR